MESCALGSLTRTCLRMLCPQAWAFKAIFVTRVKYQESGIMTCNWKQMQSTGESSKVLYTFLPNRQFFASTVLKPINPPSTLKGSWVALPCLAWKVYGLSTLCLSAYFLRRIVVTTSMNLKRKKIFILSMPSVEVKIVSNLLLIIHQSSCTEF